MDTLGSSISTQLNSTLTEFDSVQTSEDSLANLSSFNGHARDAAVAYFQQVDKAMRDAINELLQDISDTYYNKFLGQFPDSATYGDFDEDELTGITTNFRNYGATATSTAQNINTAIGNAIDVVGDDFCGIWNDSAIDCCEDFYQCADMANNLMSSINELNSAQQAEIARLQQHVNDVVNLIAGYAHDASMQCDTYVVGSMANNTAYAAVLADNAATDAYHTANATAIQNQQDACSTRIQTRQQDAERAQEAQDRLIGGVIDLGLDLFGAIVAFIPNPIAGVVNLPFALSDMTEDVGDIYYGATGDPTTPAFNPIRDTLFGGNANAYTFTELGVGIAGGGLSDIAKSGKTVAKDGVKAVWKDSMKQMGRATLKDYGNAVGKETIKNVGEYASGAVVSGVTQAAGGDEYQGKALSNTTKFAEDSSGVADNLADKAWKRIKK
jgi:cell division septum initiation protein DivIVA